METGIMCEDEKPSREYAIIPDLPENYIAVVEKANLNELVNNKDILSSPEKNFAEIEGSSNTSSAIASIPDNEFQKPSIVTLKFLDDTWVQLRDENDEIILSQLMNEGDEYSYNIFNNFYIYFLRNPYKAKLRLVGGYINNIIFFCIY